MCFVGLIEKQNVFLDVPDFNLTSSNDGNIDKTVDDGKLLPRRSISIVITANFVMLYLVTYIV